MAGKVEVGVLHDVHGSLLVCRGLKDDLQLTFSCHNVGERGDQRPGIPLRRITRTSDL